MTLQKKTIDKSVTYITQGEQTQSILSEGVFKPNLIKNTSRPRKQNKKKSQNNEKFIRNFAWEGFKMTRRKAHYYFQEKDILQRRLSIKKLSSGEARI